MLCNVTAGNKETNNEMDEETKKFNKKAPKINKMNARLY